MFDLFDAVFDDMMGDNTQGISYSVLCIVLYMQDDVICHINFNEKDLVKIEDIALIKENMQRRARSMKDLIASMSSVEESEGLRWMDPLIEFYESTCDYLALHLNKEEEKRHIPWIVRGLEEKINDFIHALTKKEKESH